MKGKWCVCGHPEAFHSAHFGCGFLRDTPYSGCKCLQFVAALSEEAQQP